MSFVERREVPSSSVRSGGGHGRSHSRGSQHSDKMVAPGRPIRSVYYHDHRAREVSRVNHAGHANHAVALAVEHLQVNHYEAVLCEVFDERDGVLHAVLKRPIGGTTISIIYEREVREGM
jgi:hypothetical protein